MDDRRSERFGRYEILTELGRGAMGVVYKARDPKINRVVAVKTVSMAGQAAEEEREYRERFFREAEAAGRLSHPGIVTIFDVGEEPETRAPYIVMEFVGGQSLDKLLSRNDQKLQVEAALQLTLELAEALDCAHGQGVVHRDLKPANILMTEDGHAKIADFGIAKLNLANHTLAGRSLGTPAYMSPEQLNGETVDGRGDLFSLGVILYSVLTGYSPFQGNSAITVSFKVVNCDPIPATLLDTDLPQGLDYIIARAMAKDPAERYQRGMEMVLDIQELRAGREPWSKAKLPDSQAGKGAVRAANDRASLSPGDPRITAKLLESARSHSPGHNNAHDLIEMFRKKFIVSVLVLAGLFTFGSWEISFGPHAARSRAAVPLVAGALVPVKAATTYPAPATGVAPVAAPPINPAPSKGTSTGPSNVSVATPSVTSPIISSAVLEIEVEHKFAEAHLSIRVDNRLTYTHILAGTDTKRLAVFHRVQGHEFHFIQLTPGKHRLRVRVTSEEPAYDESATVAGAFASGRENMLRINFNKRGEMNLGLN